MSIGSKQILNLPTPCQKLNYLATKASSSIGSNYTVFGLLTKENLWLFLSSIILIFCPITSGEESFPGYISCLIHFKSAKKRSGHSLPRKDEGRRDTSLLIQNPGNQSAHVLLLTSQHALNNLHCNMQTGVATASAQFGFGSVSFSLPHYSVSF